MLTTEYLNGTHVVYRDDVYVGTKEAGERFRKLPPFVRGYLEAVFFTEATSDNEDLEGATFSDMAPHTVAYVVTDCTNWQAANVALLALAYDREDYSEEQAGRDYWFTRNGHGVGFWDREQIKAEDLGDALTTACEHRAVWVYRGDDGQVYVDNEA